MDPRKLIADLKKGLLQPAYLLHGEEGFLVHHYAQAIEAACIKKDSQIAEYKEVFEGPIPTPDIIMAANTLPFFASHKLILLKDTKLFVTGRKADAEKMAAYLPHIPPETTLIFIEKEVDKRGKLFKEISKTGLALDCQRPDGATLSKWVLRTLKDNQKHMAPPTVATFIQTVGSDMYRIANELEKLMAYVDVIEGGNEAPVVASITEDHIWHICTPTLESRIFDLIKAMLRGQLASALTMYRDMLLMKESPLMVLSMIIRQFRIIYLSKCAKEQGMTVYQAASLLKLRDFMVSEALTQGSRFTTGDILSILRHCLETDVQIKTGGIAPELGVEMLMIKYGQKVDMP